MFLVQTALWMVQFSALIYFSHRFYMNFKAYEQYKDHEWLEFAIKDVVFFSITSVVIQVLLYISFIK